MLRCSISGFTEPLKALRGIGLRQDYQIRASLLGPGHCCPHPFLRSWDAAGIHSDSPTWRAPSLVWLFRTRRYLHRRLNRTSHRIKLFAAKTCDDTLKHNKAHAPHHITKWLQWPLPTCSFPLSVQRMNFSIPLKALRGTRVM